MKATKISFGSNLTQIAWVVKDIIVAEGFFKNTMGISNSSQIETIRAKDFVGTSYGKPSNAESLIAQAYSGGIFIELIQPISGNSIFQDYLDKNPAGVNNNLSDYRQSQKEKLFQIVIVAIKKICHLKK